MHVFYGTNSKEIISNGFVNANGLGKNGDFWHKCVSIS